MVKRPEASPAERLYSVESGATLTELSVAMLITGLLLGSVFWLFIRVSAAFDAWHQESRASAALFLARRALTSDLEATVRLDWQDTLAVLHRPAPLPAVRYRLAPDGLFRNEMLLLPSARSFSFALAGDASFHAEITAHARGDTALHAWTLPGPLLPLSSWLPPPP